MPPRATPRDGSETVLAPTAFQIRRGEISPKWRWGERRDVPGRSGLSRFSGYPEIPSSRNPSSMPTAPFSPGLPVTRIAADRSGAASRPTSPGARESGQEEGPGTVFGARSGEEGSARDRHFLQKGVNTRYGPPPEEQTSSGSKRREPLNVSVFHPPSARPRATAASRLPAAGSKIRFQ